jgi:hypothetical protein
VIVDWAVIPETIPNLNGLRETILEGQRKRKKENQIKRDSSGSWHEQDIFLWLLGIPIPILFFIFLLPRTP